MVCANCGKTFQLQYDQSQYDNYCDWNCHIEDAKKQGGRTILPNGLPIQCIMANGDMLEIEHGDHPDYKFPVKIEYIGDHVAVSEWDDSYKPQHHALIYADRCIAVTMYETDYYMWRLSTGVIIGSTPGFNAPNWRLTEESRAEITRRIP